MLVIVVKGIRKRAFFFRFGDVVAFFVFMDRTFATQEISISLG